MVTLAAWAAVGVLAAVLLAAGKIDALRGTPRSRWLSFAGGVAITYVFLKLLPELVEAQRKVGGEGESSGWLRGHMLFLAALAGATALYAVERAAKRTKQQCKAGGGEERAAAWVFWPHAALMSPYVALIGYALFQQEPDRTRSVAALGAVMALHFAGTAVALQEDYRSLYTSRGRWLLAAAVVAGGAVGYAGTLPETFYYFLLAFLAGAVVFSSIKEEIPPERQSRFWALAAGVLAAGALLWGVG